MNGRIFCGALGVLVSIYLLFAGLRRFDSEGFEAVAMPLILIILSAGYLAQARRQK